MDVLGAIGDTSMVRLRKVAERLGPRLPVVTLMADSGLKYLHTDVYRRR